jgi:class 3 adenylate cyclase/tetratricopeptide (TPR) repeat protein
MPACPTCGVANPADARFCSACGASLTPDPATPSRKTVTVLFCDLEGFTALTERLDPESLHALMARYFKAMRGAIDRHGGRVEKYIGDAVMAVFGHPQLHEDDAVRAARCALEMRDALSELNDELQSGWGVTLHARYGLSTGEVAFARVGAHPFFALGDAVNLAQRLEAAAPPDEVLICPQTARLLSGGADLTPLEPLELKGKAAPVAAWRLLALRPAGDAARAPPPARIVDRDPELQILRAALTDAVAERRCRLVTVVGPAGVGKSCLVRSFVRDAETSATAVSGRCLSYGEGITFWPLAQIVEQLAGRADEGAIAALVGHDEEGRWVAERAARAVGFAPGPTHLEEIQLALRRLLEAAARRRPLVVIVEDIHWAEPTLLDVLEYVAAHAHGIPLLLVCLARPELLERRPTALLEDSIELRSLSDRHCGDLLERLDPMSARDPAERVRLLDAAEGNPLFLEQMVALKLETGSATTIPPTIQALLAARIDGLPAAEREVIDCAAVEGRQFHRSSVAELLGAPYRDALDGTLASLVKRELIRPGGADLPGEEGYRFSHILVRDAVYALLSKARRADLHQGYARWLAIRAEREREFGEIIGFHYEQAYRCTAALQPVPGPDQRRLGRAGARFLGGVGRAALGRGDLPASVNLLERAIAMLEDDEPALGWLLPELGTALTQAGRLSEAERVLAPAVKRAAEHGKPSHEAHALVCLLFVRLQVDTGAAALEVRRQFSDLAATFTTEGDELGLDRLWRLRALVHWLEARSSDAERDWLMAVEHADRAGDEQGRADALSWLASSVFEGPTPADEGIARCEAIRGDLRGNRRAEAFVLQPLAGLWAMRGEFRTARELLAHSNAMMAELGITMDTAVPYHEAFVALLAGDPAEAEVSLRAGYERLREMGEKALRADTAAMLARAVHAQGRLDEALDLTREAEEEADLDDLSAQFVWRAVRAQILAHRGAFAEADRLATEAVALVEGTDWLTDHADVLMARAEVLVASGQDTAAEATVREALALYERKGNSVAAARARKHSQKRAPA